jgi:hypothetical protein
VVLWLGDDGCATEREGFTAFSGGVAVRLGKAGPFGMPSPPSIRSGFRCTALRRVVDHVNASMDRLTAADRRRT